MGGVISTVPGLSLPSASLIDAIYPVGVIYESDDPTTPSLVFGRGTWERIAGRMLIGVDEGDPDLNAAGKTGGEKSHVLTAAEMPAHNHAATATGSHAHGPGAIRADTIADHVHTIPAIAGVQIGTGSGGNYVAAWVSGVSLSTSQNGGHSHSIVGNTGYASPNLTVSINNSIGGQAHNNMPPFRAVYMWRRTA